MCIMLKLKILKKFKETNDIPDLDCVPNSKRFKDLDHLFKKIAKKRQNTREAIIRKK